MNYNQTVNWLFNQLPVYQLDGVFKYKVNLEPILNTCDYLNNPQNKFRSIHVAGTNGKGSSSHMLSSILQEAGLKVGLYTSPHLLDFRERIKLNGKLVEKDFVSDFVTKNMEFFKNNKISFFEMTVAMAFDYFAKSNVDIAIIETGLGGRLDSTNILNPLVSLITNIGLDHKEFLGNNLKDIASEKAGIIKKDIPIVISEFQKETYPIFENKAQKIGTDIFLADNQKKFKTDLSGDFQIKNINGVVKVISLLKSFSISNNDINSGLLNVQKNTGLTGRLQILKESPKVICDVGHNLDAFKVINDHIKSLKFKNLKLVLGFVKGKDFKKIINILPSNAHYFFCKPNIERGLSLEDLADYGSACGLKYSLYNSVSDAYKSALLNSKDHDLIFIGGSNFTVSEVLVK
ncbi:bifunctional folylpolyglutamate synthase/dihydrofolate synthase [Flavobacteriaceae bacterium]|nr:bifunctional folylpolyglutamate synthase/dihydrofolate synthase [Flavobacteriaceae bacterium]